MTRKEIEDLRKELRRERPWWVLTVVARKLNKLPEPETEAALKVDEAISDVLLDAERYKDLPRKEVVKKVFNKAMSKASDLLDLDYVKYFQRFSGESVDDSMEVREMWRGGFHRTAEAVDGLVDARMALEMLGQQQRALVAWKAEGYSFEEIAEFFFMAGDKSSRSKSAVGRRCNEIESVLGEKLGVYGKGLWYLLRRAHEFDYVWGNDSKRTSGEPAPPKKIQDMRKRLIDLMMKNPEGSVVPLKVRRRSSLETDRIRTESSTGRIRRQSQLPVTANARERMKGAACN